MKIEIKESVEELHKLLKEQKTVSGKQRVQALYLLKSQKVTRLTELAEILGNKRVTIHRWLKLYREGGISNLLLERKSTGRPPIINLEIREKLEKELKQPEGFKSYEEIRRHLQAVEGIEVSYKVVHDTVHYQMSGKLKVPRPVGIKHDEEAEEEFKKKLPETLETIKKHFIPPSEQSRSLRYWCEDESRLGLKTEVGRLITVKGVKPLGTMQWKRENFYLYGLVEPLTGEYFIWEFSHLNTTCFQIFLEKFAVTYSNEIHIIQLDNGAFHLSQYLKVPANIILLFQPAHTPQVNPIERLWQEIKRNLKWECFQSLDELRVSVQQRLEQLNTSIVASITGWGFILDALFVSGFS